MDYVALLRFRESLTVEERDAAFVRRAGWQHPAGTTPIAEYWPLAKDVQVVTVFAADSFAGVMQLTFEWNDVFDIDVFPAVSADEGLQVGAEVFAKLPRLQAGS